MDFMGTITAYPIVFALTILIIGIKAVVVAFLWNRLMIARREQGFLAKDFLFSMFILILCFLISRILYTIFDFGLTDLNPNNYYIKPAVYYWQMGGMIGQLGIAYMAWIVDKKVLNNKFKGFFAIYILVFGIIWGLYPINSKEDFDLVSLIGIIGSLGGIFIPVIFFWIGFKTPGLRRIAWSIAIGITLYAVAAILINEALLQQLRDAWGLDLKMVQNIMHLIFTSLKVTALLLLAYGGRQFKI